MREREMFSDRRMFLDVDRDIVEIPHVKSLHAASIKLRKGSWIFSHFVEFVDAGSPCMYLWDVSFFRATHRPEISAEPLIVAPTSMLLQQFAGLLAQYT